MAPNDEKIPWKDVAEVAQAHGSELDDRTIRELCKRLFGLDMKGELRPRDTFARYNIGKAEASERKITTSRGGRTPQSVC